jgi:hypothetical protein
LLGFEGLIDFEASFDLQAPRHEEETIMRGVLTLIAAGLFVGTAAAQDDERLVPLVEGADPAQFELVGIDASTMSITPEGGIRLTGKPNGYFATKKPYHNYVLRYEWMYERPSDLSDDATFRGNSGLLLHIEAPHKVWPKCIEAQLANRDAGRTFAINGATFEGKHDPAKQKQAIKPVGEWNVMEVTCQDGAITTKINGTTIAEGKGASPDRGTIGWQSEGAPIRFRNLRIREIP